MAIFAKDQMEVVSNILEAGRTYKEQAEAKGFYYVFEFKTGIENACVVSSLQIDGVELACFCRLDVTTAEAQEEFKAHCALIEDFINKGALVVKRDILQKKIDELNAKINEGV